MAQIPRARSTLSASVSTDVQRPASLGLGEGLEELGSALQERAKKQKDIADSIEAADLIAEHHIQLNDTENQIRSGGFKTAEMTPEFTKRSKDITKDILKRASNAEVQALLGKALPSRNAERVIGMADYVDKKFASEKLAEYRSVQDKLQTAVAGTADPNERKRLRGMIDRTTQAMEALNLISPERAQDDRAKINRGLDMMEVEQRINQDPKFGLKVFTNPAEIIKEYPNIKIEDLKTIGTESIQVEDRNYRLYERRKKLIQEERASAVSEEIVNGRMSLEQLNKLNRAGFLDDGFYRTAAQAIRKQEEEGGIGDDAAFNRTKTRILMDENVSKASILRMQGLNAKQTQDLLKLVDTQKDDGNKTDPRMKGPLYQSGKRKIYDVITGGGLLAMMDQKKAEKAAKAIDIYHARVQAEPNKSHAEISDDIIRTFGTGPTEQSIPQKYRTKEGKLDKNKVMQDWNNMDPATRNLMIGIGDALRARDEAARQEESEESSRQR